MIVGSKEFAKSVMAILFEIKIGNKKNTTASSNQKLVPDQLYPH